MTALESAIELDIQQQIEKATQKYEDVIAELNPSLDAFINLAFIYWQATEYGFNASNGLSLSFIEQAGKRYNEVLNLAQTHYRHDSRIKFWEKYFRFVSLGDPSFVEECKDFVSSSEAPLDVYFYLYDQTGDRQYLPEVKKILEITAQQPTTKNRYIASVLESDILRFNHGSWFGNTGTTVQSDGSLLR